MIWLEVVKVYRQQFTNNVLTVKVGNQLINVNSRLIDQITNNSVIDKKVSKESIDKH